MTNCTNVFVLFNGRTGSSYLMQVLGMCKDSKVYCEYGEIFTSRIPILKTLKADEKLGIKEEEYKGYARNNPYKYISFINSNSNSKFLCSKIQIPFLCSLNKEERDKIMDYPNSKIVVTERNIVDAYISSKKASTVKRWSKIDTTDVKLVVDFKDFLKYYQKIVRNRNKLSENYDCLFIKYEDVHNRNRKTDDQKIRYILSQLLLIGVKMEIDPIKRTKTKLLYKQDRNKSQQRKIKNYKEFKGFLRRKKLDYLLA